MSYTGNKKLSTAELKQLRDEYNEAGDFSDRSFMNGLFHGLDHLIEINELYERAQRNQASADRAYKEFCDEQHSLF